MMEHINTEYIIRDEEKHSGIAVIIVDSAGENSIVVASGSNMALTHSDVTRAGESIKQARILLIQLEIPLESVYKAVEIGFNAGATVILNPAPACPLDESVLSKVHILTPNETEASELSGIEVCDEQSAAKAAEVLREKGAETVIVTMGDMGSLVVTGEGVMHFPALKISPVDTTAAGDAFNGALAVALAQGQSLEEAVMFANKAGALSATKLGAQPSLPTVKDIGDFFD